MLGLPTTGPLSSSPYRLRLADLDAPADLLQEKSASPGIKTRGLINCENGSTYHALTSPIVVAGSLARARVLARLEAGQADIGFAAGAAQLLNHSR
jgi:hypothetical protein